MEGKETDVGRDKGGTAFVVAERDKPKWKKSVAGDGGGQKVGVLGG